MGGVTGMLGRRRFLKLSGVTAATGAAASMGLPLFHLRANEATVLGDGSGAVSRPKIGSWQDLYRQRWTWDYIAKGSHGWLNCRSACNWDIYVKNGVVVREEQAANYEASEDGVPDFNPRGCQKGACYTEVMYGPSRLTIPMKRVGERGSGQWQKLSWEQAIDEIATKFVDIAEEHGTESVILDLGPHFDQGATTVARMKFFAKSGGSIADDWAEIGDLNLGNTLTFGFPHLVGSSDKLFLSDMIVVRMMNPSVTQIPDAHFIYEARYKGADVVVIDPQYSATTIHADHWLPISPGTDAALALAVSRYIWESDTADWNYVKEQTDFPMLVRMDTGRFLRESDVEEGGRTDGLYLWDGNADELTFAPGCEGDSGSRIKLGDIDPVIEGQFSVDLANGETVQVVTVGSLIKEHLAPWDFKATAEITGLSVAQIKQFSELFAKAKRPMILSSWGSNRFLHSDLMNRAKNLILSLKGAIGKKGSGLNATGWFGMEGFEMSAETEQTGLSGLMAAVFHQFGIKDIFNAGIDLVARRKSTMELMREAAKESSTNGFCSTNSASINYNYQGIDDVLAEEQDGLGYPKKLSEYVKESQDKGWMPVHPERAKPKAWITGGNNVLRRTNMPQKMLENMWPELDLILDINPKLTFTGMHCDYLLPAAGYYEKPGFKYPVAYVPYLHYCDAAVAPVGDSKDEWEIYSLLAKRVSEIAQARKMPVTEGCGKRPVDLKRLYEQFSSNGAFGPNDANKVNQQILDLSTSTVSMTVDEMKKTGIKKYTSTGSVMVQSQLYNGDWEGEGVVTPATHQVKDKWKWPTLTGRQQYYIDHQWFIDAGESLPTHKGSPKAGGDYPFQMISCHSRWSIHSIWRDTPMLLRFQRGEPCIYLNPMDGKKTGVADGAWASLSNRLGDIRMRVKHSTMVRPSVAYYFHAWEPYQFPDHKSYKWITPGLMNPMHFAGGEGHVGWFFAIFEPGTHVQDTRVDIKPWVEKTLESLAKEAAS